MKIQSIFLLAALAFFATSCGGDDEPSVSDATMMSETHGKTVFQGTDIYFDSECRLVSPSKQYSISLCKVKDLDGIVAQQVSVSLNWRIKIAQGNIYAVAPVERIRNFKSGAMALEIDAPVTYIKVTELIKDGNEVTGFHYQTLQAKAERGTLPAWGSVYKFRKMDEDSWNYTLPLTFGQYEIAMFDDLYQMKYTNAEHNYINVEINHRWIREDHSTDYEQRLLVTYVLDSEIYIRNGGVCTRAIVRE